MHSCAQSHRAVIPSSVHVRGAHRSLREPKLHTGYMRRYSKLRRDTGDYYNPSARFSRLQLIDLPQPQPA